MHNTVYHLQAVQQEPYKNAHLLIIKKKWRGRKTSENKKRRTNDSPEILHNLPVGFYFAGQ